MGFPLSNFYIIKLLFFDSDFNDEISSLIKFRGALFLLDELNYERSLILAYKSCFIILAYIRLYYRKYVDDIFAIFRSPHHLDKFRNSLNSKHKNIKFFYEKQNNYSQSFLDILISRSKNGFTTSAYHKATFRGVYCNFNSFIRDQYKIGLVFALLFRTFSIACDVSRFHTKSLI